MILAKNAAVGLSGLVCLVAFDLAVERIVESRVVGKNEVPINQVPNDPAHWMHPAVRSEALVLLTVHPLHPRGV